MEICSVENNIIFINVSIKYKSVHVNNVLMFVYGWKTFNSDLRINKIENHV